MVFYVFLGAALLLLPWVGAAWHWRKSTRRAIAELARSAGPAAPIAAAAGDLPEPVRRYLDFALGSRAGRPILGGRLEQEGDFALRPGAWKPFSAVQHYRIQPPGFVWDARIAVAPLLAVRVRDAYAGGRGRMKASFLGLVPLADLSGGGELAVASLQRFLAELPWLPTALEPPAAGITWTAIDARRARATLLDGDVAATADFEFGDRGEIAGVSALRSRAVGEAMVTTPWEGRFWDYREVAGLQLPHQAEVAWILPEGRFPYFRARIGRVELDRG